MRERFSMNNVWELNDTNTDYAPIIAEVKSKLNYIYDKALEQVFTKTPSALSGYCMGYEPIDRFGIQLDSIPTSNYNLDLCISVYIYKGYVYGHLGIALETSADKYIGHIYQSFIKSRCDGSEFTDESTDDTLFGQEQKISSLWKSQTESQWEKPFEYKIETTDGAEYISIFADVILGERLKQKENKIYIPKVLSAVNKGTLRQLAYHIIDGTPFEMLEKDGHIRVTIIEKRDNAFWFNSQRTDPKEAFELLDISNNELRKAWLDYNRENKSLNMWGADIVKYIPQAKHPYYNWNLFADFYGDGCYVLSLYASYKKDSSAPLYSYYGDHRTIRQFGFQKVDNSYKTLSQSEIEDLVSGRAKQRAEEAKKAEEERQKKIQQAEQERQKRIAENTPILKNKIAQVSAVLDIQDNDYTKVLTGIDVIKTMIASKYNKTYDKSDYEWYYFRRRLVDTSFSEILATCFNSYLDDKHFEDIYNSSLLNLLCRYQSWLEPKVVNQFFDQIYDFCVENRSLLVRGIDGIEEIDVSDTYFNFLKKLLVSKQSDDDVMRMMIHKLATETTYQDITTNAKEIRNKVIKYASLIYSVRDINEYNAKKIIKIAQKIDKHYIDKVLEADLSDEILEQIPVSTVKNYIKRTKLTVAQKAKLMSSKNAIKKTAKFASGCKIKADIDDIVADIKSCGLIQVYNDGKDVSSIIVDVLANDDQLEVIFYTFMVEGRVIDGRVLGYFTALFNSTVKKYRDAENNQAKLRLAWDNGYTDDEQDE